MRPNTLYCGDCLQVLQTQVPNESIDLIYMDPPFGTEDDYEIVFRDGVEVRHFKDRWVGGKQGYLRWVTPIIRRCAEVLKDTGSFYFHCDDHLDGYLRQVCDATFGESNFRNEIIWKRTSGHSDSNRYGRAHDVILFYTKSGKFTWTPQFQPYGENYLKTHYRYKTPDGRVYRTDNLTAGGLKGGGYEYEWKGVRKLWRLPIESMRKLDAEGLVKYTKNGVAERVRFLGKGTKLQDVWTDISPVNSQAEERQGYPTQKPPELLTRIIEASSKPGDIVLDPVCGCGTAVLAAHEKGRYWVGIDISPTACRLIASRFGIPDTEVVGLPRSLAEVKAIMALDPRGIEFQNWVCDLLHAVSTTKRGDAPRPDGGIDGWILNTIPISVKGSESIGYPVVERFLTTMRKNKAEEGYMVAFSFAKPAFAEAQRARREENLMVDLLEPVEVTRPNGGDRPEVNTYLHSQITQRTWGDQAATGPARPEPFVVPLKTVKKARVRRLTESPPETEESEDER